MMSFSFEAYVWQVEVWRGNKRHHSVPGVLSPVHSRTSIILMAVSYTHLTLPTKRIV